MKFPSLHLQLTDEAEEHQHGGEHEGAGVNPAAFTRGPGAEGAAGIGLPAAAPHNSQDPRQSRGLE